MDSKKLINAVTQVTGAWAKQRQAEEREAKRALRRREALIRYRRYTIKDAAWETMREAYMKTSANNTLPAHARQIMYAARGYIQEQTGETLNDMYFTQTLLPDYLNECPDETEDWDVVFDARGHLYEPHTGIVLPLGTLQVRDYLRKEAGLWNLNNLVNFGLPILCPMSGPSHRYQAILFIEKEGFMPLFKKVRLSERYDIAIMSTKGLSTTAARLLVDELCSDMPLLVSHDFDKAGFSIAGTLQRDTRRYSFRNDTEVIDLGLRLADVEENSLAAEAVIYGRSDPTYNLRQNGATKAEIQFLYQGRNYSGYYGERVELNAFTSDHLVRWIEAKLQQHGIQKVVPDDETLQAAYRRAVALKHLDAHLKGLLEEATRAGQEVAIQPDLRERVLKELKEHPDLPWDKAMYHLAWVDVNG